jgi:sarcosine oxidase subunit beta
MSGNAADVIVVGGGIMGAATAFFLRKRGRSVILLERDLVGQAASGTNFGNVRRQGRFLPQLPLAHRSRAIWGDLPGIIGDDAEFVETGHLRIAFRQTDAERIAKYAEDARHWGLEIELFSANALRARFPFVATDAVFGSFSPHDGHANPRLATPAFARAARREGAQVHENTEVLGIARSGEDFVVETTRGQFRAPALQISAGAWGRAMAASFDEDVPLVARGPQMGVTEPAPYRIGPVLNLASTVEHEGVYLRQVARGNIVFGGGARTDVALETRRAHVDPRNTLNQLPQLRRLLPMIGELHVIRTWSGVEGYVADDIPVMGASAKQPGLFYAFGFCGHGFQLGPGVGETMAQLIATGDPGVSIEPFSVARFQKQQAPIDRRAS